MEGRTAAQAMRSEIKARTRAFGPQVKPNLATILVGANPASKAYLRAVHSACADTGFKSHSIELAADITQRKLEETIVALSSDPSVTGVILQLPLPQGLDDAAACACINPAKDVDGLNPYNLGLLYQKRRAKLIPCTPEGVILLLKHYRVGIAGRRAVIVNRSKLLGRPLAQLLLNEDATVTICHSKTEGLEEVCRQADVLLTGIGRRPDFTVGANMVKSGAVVIDIGTNSVKGRLVGDVDFDSVLQVASLVTPVPGGVGPMTTAVLLYNTLAAACSLSGVDMAYDPSELSTSGRL
jgi:methylenetetrahydrofolate dehydrogenase (NADP+)/methenyltetrahydrofolate cyclohydrolase